MPNLNILETFRTKEELLNYFDEIGQNITEEEIEELKQSYAKAEENSSDLSLQQLDDVAGGVAKFHAIEVTGLDSEQIIARVEELTGNNKCFTALSRRGEICSFGENANGKSFVFATDSSASERLGEIDFCLHMLGKSTEIFQNLTDFEVMQNLVINSPADHAAHKQTFFNFMYHWNAPGSEIKWELYSKNNAVYSTADETGINRLNQIVYRCKLAYVLTPFLVPVIRR